MFADCVKYVIHIIISILYYLCAESITVRPITDTAQYRYRYLHYGAMQHRVKDKLQTSTGENSNNNSIQFNSYLFMCKRNIHRGQLQS
jgi:hypothetical protein